MRGDEAEVVVVDAMNVIGARPDGWWRDRPAAQRRLYDRLAAGCRPGGPRVVVVFEGPELEDLLAGGDGPAVRWARRRGANAADDRIVEEVEVVVRSGARAIVVTSDRALRGRVAVLGARVVGPSSLDDVLRRG